MAVRSARASAGELAAFAAEPLIVRKLPGTIEFTAESLRDEAGKARRNRLRAELIAASEGS